ncbi:hypothetical protein HNV12_03060 [Methanococcoides sp. SA1]|nr:hypothetical protein [Methanococcoides sp. SA1]
METEMVNMCEECSEDQKIPIIKKPSDSQLNKADQSYSVRQRLDKMQGRRDTTDISRDQTITQKNLSKLRAPPKKQSHPDTLENYHWSLNMARRRAKMTTSQLASKIATESHKIRDIERGILPKDFKEIFLKLEALLEVKLLKQHESQVNFTRKSPDQEKEILRSVEMKMKNPEAELEELDEIKAVQEKIENEEIKLSKRKDLHNITLNDLVDRKRAREKYKMQSQESEMFGDDIEIRE